MIRIFINILYIIINSDRTEIHTQSYLDNLVCHFLNNNYTVIYMYIIWTTSTLANRPFTADVCSLYSKKKHSGQWEKKCCTKNFSHPPLKNQMVLPFAGI